MQVAQGGMRQRRFGLLAIDPGDVTGLALWTWDGEIGARFIVSHTLGAKDSPCSGDMALDKLHKATCTLQDLSMRTMVLAVEAQWLGRGKYMRAHAITALGTAGHAGGWRYVAQSLGWTVYRTDGAFGVQPMEWRQGVYGKHRVKKRDEYKAAAVKMVQLQHGIDVGHDEAEAILIGGFCCRQLGLLGVRR